MKLFFPCRLTKGLKAREVDMLRSSLWSLYIVVAVFIVWAFVKDQKNVREARSIGLALVRSPITNVTSITKIAEGVTQVEQWDGYFYRTYTFPGTLTWGPNSVSVKSCYVLSIVDGAPDGMITIEFVRRRDKTIDAIAWAGKGTGVGKNKWVSKGAYDHKSEDD